MIKLPNNMSELKMILQDNGMSHTLLGSRTFSRDPRMIVENLEYIWDRMMLRAEDTLRHQDALDGYLDRVTINEFVPLLIGCIILKIEGALGPISTEKVDKVIRLYPERVHLFEARFPPDESRPEFW